MTCVVTFVPFDPRSKALFKKTKVTPTKRHDSRKSNRRNETPLFHPEGGSKVSDKFLTFK